jgi:Cu2+-exporting ATPase
MLHFGVLIPAGLVYVGYAGFKWYQDFKTKGKTLSSSFVKKKCENKGGSHFFGNMRFRQSEENLPAAFEKEMIEKKEKSDWEFAVASASLGLITGALFVQSKVSIVLIIGGVSGIIHNLVPLLQESYKALFEERRVCVAVVDSIAVSGLLITGHYFMCAITDWIFFLGYKLVAKTKDKSLKSLVNVFEELPNFVWILKDGVEIEVPLDTLISGDIVVVNAGETIPADGTITEGIALIDQHILTGESQPAEKQASEQVFASTLVLGGRIHIRITESGKDTVVAKIGEVLSRTADYRTFVQARGEELANKAALPTLVLSAASLPFLGNQSALAILYSYIGDSMRIVAPVSTLNFFEIASKGCILIKDGRALELLSKVNTVVFDKTGTLTKEQPRIGKIHTFDRYTENEVLKYAATAEYKQMHPIAKALLGEAHNRGITPLEIGEADYEIGYGIRTNLLSKVIRVGSLRYIETEGIPVSDEARNTISYCQKQGYSVVMIAIDNHLGGMIELHSAIRPEVISIIRHLRQRKLSLYILSGDQEIVTQRLANELGIDNYFAEVLPEDKADLIEQLQKDGKTVCFVGDGINDSIALKKAHVSVSMRGASTIATDTAQVILMDKSLRQICHLFDLSDELKNNLNAGFLTTIVPGVITIGGVFFLHFGLNLSCLLYFTGLASGVINSMLPLIKHRNKGIFETSEQRHF